MSKNNSATFSLPKLVVLDCRFQARDASYWQDDNSRPILLCILFAYTFSLHIPIRYYDLSVLSTLTQVFPSYTHFNLHRPFRIAMGLWFVWQPYPRSYALYEVSVL